MSKIISVILVALSVATATAWFAAAGDRQMKCNALTPEKERVILQRGTEPPFSGKYYQHKEPGLYLCKRCGAALFRSEDKFESGCGWPAFDAEIPGVVERHPDQDGERTEIACARCGAHLGHVFRGEGLKN